MRLGMSGLFHPLVQKNPKRRCAPHSKTFRALAPGISFVRRTSGCNARPISPQTSKPFPSTPAEFSLPRAAPADRFSPSLNDSRRAGVAWRGAARWHAFG